MDYLVTYDVATIDKEGERRLRRVAKLVEGYGVRVQYSVFEMRGDKTSLARLVVGIKGIIESSSDTVRVYTLGTDGLDRVVELGRAKSMDPRSSWTL